MAITQAEIKTTAKLLVGVGALAGAPGVGTANTVIGIGTSLMDLYSGRRPETGWQAKVTEALEAKLADPEFHRPALADRLLPQLIELGLPNPEELTGEGWKAEAVAVVMRRRVPERSSDPAHASEALLDAYEAWVGAGLAPLLDDPAFVSGQAGAITREMFDRFAELKAGQDTTHEKLDEILRRLGGGSAALADPEALSLEELQALAANFGEAEGATKAELIGFIETKRQEHEAFVAEINAINEQTAGLGNLKAAARAAAESLDYAEVETLLARVDEVETEIAVQTKELRADNALLRGRVEEAHRLLSAAADSFGSVDPVEPARKRVWKYFEKLWQHGLRYGGSGLSLSAAMAHSALAHLSETETPHDWAAAQVLLGLALADQGIRMGGEAGAARLSDAIAAYHAALQVQTEADHPLDWAVTQNNLGAALRNQGSRTGGADGAALLAEAVAAYRAALRIYTETEQSENWAATQNNLGAALADQGSRTSGEAGAALLAEAVAADRAALRIYTEAEQPENWAMTQNNLGAALADRGRRTDGADAAALFSDAVAAYRAALRVYTEADHPVRWAGTQNNLGNALNNQGSRTGGKAGAALLSEAMGAYRAALRVYTQTAHPVDWAMTQNNLGTVLSDQGRRADGATGAALLEDAVAAYCAALQVYTEADHPVHWAATQNNLGIALNGQGSRTGGKAGAALLSEAVAACRAALLVRTEADHPVDWAQTQNSLALALNEQLKLEDAKTARILWAEAVAACVAALRVNTRESQPVEWAMRHESAALIHEAFGDHAGREERSEVYGLALEAICKSLEVYDPEHLALRFENAVALKTRLEAKLAELQGGSD